ncbi:MAG TPA: glycosyltransferase family 9 protein [Pedobacter sp.]|jgi:lipopolysaccharide heptosyltransferase II
MSKSWADAKSILCIRLDNMGDLLMSSPAIRALKETFNSRITLLTSSMATGIAGYIDEINDVITYDLPWVKANQSINPEHFFEIIEEIKKRRFDAAVIFTVYSQNPLPTAMLPFLAGIPLRLSYCRENPYELLTDWIPDEEPYSVIKHQVRRDLDLVASVGAFTTNEKINISASNVLQSLNKKLLDCGVDLNRPWLILHPGVSEEKRQYPFELWVETAKKIIDELGYQVLFTGVLSEKTLTDNLHMATGENSFSLAGMFNMEEFINLIRQSPLIISVNTGTIHLATAVETPVIVLYALTNPQHYPWKVAGKVLPFSVPQHLRSKNEVIRYVNERYFDEHVEIVRPEAIVATAVEILGGKSEMIPELPERLAEICSKDL